MDAPKKSFRPWPKRHDGVRRVVDKDKMRLLYMNSGHFSWVDFCKEYGFDPSAKKKQTFPVKSWINEKLQGQIEVREEQAITPALEVKSYILNERLKFPRLWNEEADRTLSLVKAYERNAILNAQWDIQNSEEIKLNPTKKRFNLKPSDLAFLATAKKTLQDIHRGSLLVPAVDAYKAIVPIKDMDPEVSQGEAEGERLREIGIKVLGCGALDHNTMTQMCAQWIDQNSTKNETEVPNSPGPLSNEPITPLEGDNEAD